MNNKSKIEKYIEENEVPAFLRELADAIEQGGNEEYACTDDFKKFKITGKNEFGKVSIRAKFKAASECGPPPELLEDIESGEPIRPIYRNLKKRMKSSFKMITSMIHSGELPPKQAMDSFLSDSELMVSYPGYGDEYYEDYTNTCNQLKAAYEVEDFIRMQEIIVELAKQKGSCHAKYD